MNIQDFKCNGFEISKRQSATKSIRPIIQAAVALFRIRKKEHEIFASFTPDDYYAGERFNDDDAITTRICSGLVEYAQKNILKTNDINQDESLLLEGYINSIVYSLSGSEMDQIILEGMRDCATADHWYTFEKVWD